MCVAPGYFGTAYVRESISLVVRLGGVVLGDFASCRVVSNSVGGSDVLLRVARRSLGYNIYIGGVLKWVVVSPRRHIVNGVRDIAC